MARGRKSKKGSYEVFISHGWDDRWVARQMARCVREETGAEAFIDVYDIALGDLIPERVHAGLSRCDELVTLLTPTSIRRSWVWVEVGGAWSRRKRVVGVLYGLTFEELRASGGAACLEGRSCISLNEYDTYVEELSARVKEIVGGKT